MQSCHEAGAHDTCQETDCAAGEEFGSVDKPENHFIPERKWHHAAAKHFALLCFYENSVLLLADT